MENYLDAFIDSVDDKSLYSKSNLKVNEEVLDGEKLEVYALAISKKFSDGAPVLKEFDRNPTKTEFQFELNKNYPIINYQDQGFYWYEDGLWYYSEDNEILYHLT